MKQVFWDDETSVSGSDWSVLCGSVCILCIVHCIVQCSVRLIFNSFIDIFIMLNTQFTFSSCSSSSVPLWPS